MEVFKTQFNEKASLIEKVSGAKMTNSGGEFKTTKHGLALLLESGDSVTLTGLSLDVINIISYARGLGTLRIAVGANNTDIVLTNSNWINTLTTVAYTAQISVTLSCTSGKVYISTVAMSDIAFTTDELNDFAKKFLNSKILSETKRNFYYPKVTDSSEEEGLQLHYNFIPSAGGVLTDISGNGNNGEIHGALSTKEGMAFDGVNSDVEINKIWRAGEVIHMRCKFAELDNYRSLFGKDGTKSYIRLYNNLENDGVEGETATNGDTIKLLHNKNLQPNISYTFSFVWNLDKTIDLHINGEYACSSAATTDDNLTLTYLGKGYGGSSFKGEFQDFKKSSDLSIEKIQAYHNSFASQVYLKDTLRLAKCDGKDRTPIGWRKGTGNFKAVELETADSVLTEAKAGTKLLECTSAGTIAIPSKQAYGEWRGLLRVSPGHNTKIKFISGDANGNNSYNLFSDVGLRLYFKKDNTNLFYTKDHYLLNNITYEYKIIRKTNGEFTVYIKGGTFGNEFTLVDVTNGSGSNPIIDTTYTTSNYFVADLDVGDRVGNILLKKGVIV